MKISLFSSTWIFLRDASSGDLSLGGSMLRDYFKTIFIACFIDEESSGVP
jgi:hypothetical protein